MKNPPPTREEKIASLKVQIQYHVNFADMAQDDRALSQTALNAAMHSLQELNELLLTT